MNFFGDDELELTFLTNLQLRKVSDRILPEIGPKVDERDSLLAQIRTKVEAELFSCYLWLVLLNTSTYVRSHIAWRRERNILYKGVETSP